MKETESLHRKMEIPEYVIVLLSIVCNIQQAKAILFLILCYFNLNAF